MKNACTVEKALEKSDLYFKAEDEGWSVFCKGAMIVLQPTGDTSVVTSGKTGVFATDENEVAMMALMNHLGGWVQKVGEYKIAPDGEVVLEIERDLADGESVDRMVSLAAVTVGQHVQSFRGVEQGVPLDEVIETHSSEAGSFLRALRSELLD